MIGDITSTPDVEEEEKVEEINYANNMEVTGSLNAKQVISISQSNNFEQVRQEGSHRHFKYKGKYGLVTVADHGKDTIKKGTLGSIRSQINNSINSDPSKD